MPTPTHMRLTALALIIAVSTTPAAIASEEIAHIFCPHEPRADPPTAMFIEVVGGDRQMHGHTLEGSQSLLERHYGSALDSRLVANVDYANSGLSDLPQLCSDARTALGLPENQFGSFLIDESSAIVFSAPGVFIPPRDKRRILSKHGIEVLANLESSLELFQVGEALPNSPAQNIRTGESTTLDELAQRVLVFFPSSCSPCAAEKMQAQFRLVQDWANGLGQEVAVVFSAPTGSEVIDILGDGEDTTSFFFLSDEQIDLSSLYTQSREQLRPKVLLLSDARVLSATQLTDAHDLITREWGE